MKSILIILFSIVLSYSVQGQNRDMSSKYLVSRLDFRYKQNKYLKKMPVHLLRAFSEGYIKAYFPAAPDKELSFENFLSHFGMPEEAVTAGLARGPEQIECPGQISQLMDPAIGKCFSSYLDLFEAHRFDKQRSVYEYKIEYVQLMFSYQCTQNGLEYKGPVFLLKDILKLPERFFVENKVNEANPFTYPKIFLERNFKTILIKEGEVEIDVPGKKETRPEQKRKESESTIWDN